jgi:uncharacterized membrane protein
MNARRTLPWPMIGATVALLAAAFALQLAAYGHGATSAISDLPRVLVNRGIGPGSLPYVDRVIEYPVGSGILLFLATLIAPGPLGALAVTAVASSALCVAITVALQRRFGARAWRWALGAPVFLYAFQNWDVFAVAALLGAVFAYERHHDRGSGLLIGVGAAVKLFPAVLLPPLVALRLAHGDRRGALRLATSAIAGFAVLNLPFLLARPSGWWWPYAFQSHRQATWGTAWFYVFRILGLPVHGVAGANFANAVSLVVLSGGVVWLAARARHTSISPAAIAVAGVALFLLSNKVYSPTYDLWLVPAFVLLPFLARWWIAFCAVDVGVFVSVYGFFHGFVPMTVVGAVLPVLVLLRTVILIRVIAGATAKRRAVAATPAPSMADAVLTAA